jgi:hypothetical protein
MAMVAAALGLVAGCAGADPLRTAAEEGGMAIGQGVPVKTMEAALADAMGRASASRSEVTVRLAQAVVWPDGSLGCPQPGVLYTQALVPGYLIVLEARSKTFEYHAGRAGNPVYCPAERVTPPAPDSEPT